jgi:hypothetical protein
MSDEIPKGRAKGGYARAARLTKDQRSAIASEAAKIRWKDHRLPDAPRVLEGFKSELNLAGVKIPCAVISGPQGIQRVLTENGITYAILGERSGASKRLKKAASEEGALLPLFVAPSQLKPFISKELEDGPLKPIDYRDGDRIVRGYDASVLVVVCNIWLSARQAGALQTQQLPKALWAGSLVRRRLTPSGGITSTTRDEAGGMSQAKR